MRRALQRASETVTVEHRAVRLSCTQGAVPRALRGTLFRNGPGRLERGDVHYNHPFDGDGMITRFAFDEGEVVYSNRFVRTRELEAEEEAGRVLYRGFGTNLPGGLLRNALRFRFKNAANTNVIAHGGRLLALWEGGWPHRLEPETLETLERFSFSGGLLNPFSRIERAIAPELPFSAHPSIDPETGEMFNFGIAYGARNRLLVYRISADDVLDEPRVVELDRMSFVHDFVLTPNWCVFFLPRVDFKVGRALLGLTTPVDSLSIQPEAPMTALLVPRRGGEPVRIELCSGFVFHFAHGYEDGTGRLVLDGMRMAGFPDLSDYDLLFSERGIPESMPRPFRFVLDPVKKISVIQSLSRHPAELPRVASDQGRGAHTAFWCTAAPPERPQPYLSALLRLEPEGCHATLRELYPDLPGEPVIVRDDDGQSWLLSLVYRAREHVSDLLILHPETLETQACLRLPHHVPPGFHGNWTPS